MAESNSLLKCFDLAIDLKRPVAIRPFEVVEGDTGNRLTVALTDDGEACDLTGLRIMAVFSHSKGISVEDSADGSVTADENVISIELYPSAFAPGMVECELQIYSSSEEEPESIEDYDVLVTTAKFNFSCRRAILNGESIACAPQFPLLAQTIVDIQTAEAIRDEAESIRRQNEEARASAELGRIAAESGRVLAENQRLLNESSRVSAESARASAESARAAAETARESAETVRGQNELSRQAAENLRALAETQRDSAETARSTAESARASAETARASAETARASAETARATAETARASAETAREAAETAREASLASAIAALGAGTETGENDPTSTTSGEKGKLYYSTSTGRLFVCSDVIETVPGDLGRATYVWKRVATGGDWKTVTSFTLTENAGVIEIDEDSNGEAFSYDELRLTVLGLMTGGSTVSIFLNDEQKSMTFSSFINTTATSLSDSVTVLMIPAQHGGVVAASKFYGGASGGAISAKGDSTGVMIMSTPAAYSKLTIEGYNSSYLFASGARFILEGRDLE